MAKKENNIPENKSEVSKSAKPHGDSQGAMRNEFLFEGVNYKLLLIGIAVIAFGFILMAGGGSDDPKVWNDSVFDFRRIRLAPTTVLIGFGITIWSILKNPKK
jgi:hypothetical protein